MPYGIQPSRAASALAEAREAVLYPSFRYPWEGLEAAMERSETESIWLIGYGSLLSSVSAARTIDVSERSSRLPALAFGGRREFSYCIPQTFLRERYNVTDGARYSALNCRATYEPTDCFNGILTRLFKKDLEAFRLREFAYDLKPLPAFDWHEPENPFRIAYVLDCPADAPREGHPYAADAPPQPGYYRLCRDGAANVSEEFLACFLATTFLGDGVTSVADWEKSEKILAE